MTKCLLLGNGGREAVPAEYISKGFSLYSVLPYENPSIIDAIEASNGKYIIGSPFDKELVSNFIKQEKGRIKQPFDVLLSFFYYTQLHLKNN